jgi:hypothetical protein
VKEDRPRSQAQAPLGGRRTQRIEPPARGKIVGGREQTLAKSIGRRLNVKAWLGKIHHLLAIPGKKKLSAVIASGDVEVREPQVRAEVGECIDAGVDNIPWISEQSSLAFPCFH